MFIEAVITVSGSAFLLGYRFNTTSLICWTLRLVASVLVWQHTQLRLRISTSGRYRHAKVWPPKVPLLLGDPGAHLTRGSLGCHVSRAIAAPQLVHPLLQAHASDQESQTDHATCVTIGRALCYVLRCGRESQWISCNFVTTSGSSHLKSTKHYLSDICTCKWLAF